MSPGINISLGIHNDKKVIWLLFTYNKDLIAEVKSIKAKWSQSQKSWYVSDNTHFRNLLGIEQAMIGKAVMSKIAPVNLIALQEMKALLLLKAYSPSTIKTYLNEFAQLLYLIKNKDVNSLTLEQLKSYCLYCIEKKGISINQMHSRINALKFYFENICNWEQFSVMIPRPQKPSKLPKVLSTQDIMKLFEAVNNSKHQLMLQLCYGMGLRVSEVVNLKVTDIDSSRMQVLVECAKGRKDRYVHLPETVLESLRAYYKAYKPQHFLFEGQQGGQYSIRSVQQVFKNAMQAARIKKPIGIHGLRHSYATHLLEFGTDISFIQKLLGHTDVKTTLIYAKVSNQSIQKILSPLDQIKIKKQ